MQEGMWWGAEERGLGSVSRYLKALRSFSPSACVRSFFSNSSSKRVREYAALSTT